MTTSVPGPFLTTEPPPEMGPLPLPSKMVPLPPKVSVLPAVLMAPFRIRPALPGKVSLIVVAVPRVIGMLIVSGNSPVAAGPAALLTVRPPAPSVRALPDRV